MRDLTHDIATKRIANIHFFRQSAACNIFLDYRPILLYTHKYIYKKQKVDFFCRNIFYKNIFITFVIDY